MENKETYNSKNNKNLIVIDHPLIKDKLTRLRDKNTAKKEFQENLNEICSLMAFKVFKDIPVEEINIETPVAKTSGHKLKKNIVLCPILRAGLGMVEGFEILLPNAVISHIGIYRDETTLHPQEYFFKFSPKDVGNETIVYILDPMLATGGSALFAINKLKNIGIKNINLVVLLGVEETALKINNLHPDIKIFVAALDNVLNEKGYIVPGLGDAGDRIFGTK